MFYFQFQRSYHFILLLAKIYHFGKSVNAAIPEGSVSVLRYTSHEYEVPPLNVILEKVI